MIRIFLAHASEDKEAVIDLYNCLKAKGFKPWLDKKDLLGGQNWRLEIPKAIRNSDVFIACLSQRSVAKKGYVQREFKMALNKYGDMPPGAIYLIPVRLDACDIPELRQEEYGINLRDLHWVDLFEDDGFERLIKSIEYGFGDRLGDASSDAVSSYSEPAILDMPEIPTPKPPSTGAKGSGEERIIYIQEGSKYDLRGAQFAGSFAETVTGDQIGGAINNETAEEQPDLIEALPQEQEVEDLSSERFGVNYYAKLQDLLAAGDWEGADEETADQMFQVMNLRNERWLRVEDIEKFPCLDLRNIDRLWVKHSNGKFGFSVQKEIYLQCGGIPDGKYYKEAWYKFVDTVGWQVDGECVSYKSLTFSLEGKYGHLPWMVFDLDLPLEAYRIFSRIAACNM